MKKYSKASSILKHLEFLKHKPLVIPRIISGIFRKSILRQDVLRTLDLAITGDCHYKCAFCSAFRLYKKNGPYLTVEQIKHIWQQCVELGAIHVNLTGGEPLFRDINEVCQIIANFNPSRFLVSLVTCGAGLTREKLIKLKNAGLDTLQLSLESVDPRVHDALVGISGSFDKVVAGIKYAKELGLSVCLNSVFYKGNAHEIEKLIDFSRKHKVFLVLNTASGEGSWRKEGNKRLGDEEGKIFDNFLSFAHVRHDSSTNFSCRRECPGGKERIHITAHGDVLTCPLVQVSYGNVLEEPLREIYKKMNNIEYLRKYSRICKHAFDEEYYQEVLLPIRNEEKRPVSFFNHLLFRRSKC